MAMRPKFKPNYYVVSYMHTLYGHTEPTLQHAVYFHRICTRSNDEDDQERTRGSRTKRKEIGSVSYRCFQRHSLVYVKVTQNIVVVENIVEKPVEKEMV